MKPEIIQAFLYPTSIAIIGASQDASSIGGKPLRNLINHQYKGKIYPVNPKYEQINGIFCYKSVTDIPGKVDVALVAVAAGRILRTIEECAEKGIHHLILFGSGFAESGESGRVLQEEVVEMSKKNGIHLLGPNSIGCLNVRERIPMGFSTSFESTTAFVTGNSGFASQSGALGFSLFGMAQDEQIGFSYIINTGNQVDINVLDCIEFMQQDPHTTITAAYIEGIPNGEQLIELAQQSIKLDKPLLVLKAGRSELGKQAALSHTASLAGSELAFDAISKQYGLITVNDIDDMIDAMKIFSPGKRAKGPRIASVSNSGATGITIADYCEQIGLDLLKLSNETLEKIKEVIPAYGSPVNPIDITAQALKEQGILTDTLNILVNDDQVDAIVVHTTFGGTLGKRVCEKIAAIDRKTDKPIIVILTGTKELMKPGLEVIQSEGMPVYQTAYKAMAAIKHLVTFSDKVSRSDDNQKLKERELNIPVCKPNKTIWNEYQVKPLLKEIGIDVPAGTLLSNRSQADQLTESLRYPVVCKVIADGILHKTDVGGVRINITNESDFYKAYDTILDSVKSQKPNAEIEGILVEEMITGKGVEMFIGIKKDPQFGPLIVCGLGGIYIEVLKDISIRRAPIDKTEAFSMLTELKGYPLLEGTRGGKRADIDAMAAALVRLSHFAFMNRELLTEMDINPILVLEEGKGAIALDGMIVWKNDRKEADHDVQNSHHRVVSH